jgi:hypothetical protein
MMVARKAKPALFYSLLSPISSLFFGREAEKMAGTGLELPQETAGNSSGSDQSGAESGALNAQNLADDVRLTAIVWAWPSLPESTKANILAMVRAAAER